MSDLRQIGEKLLTWYDVNARVLPWRAAPNTKQVPAYSVWLSEIMLQQTNVTTVKPYFAEFMRRWPTVQALAEAQDEAVLSAWAGLGYYARARNLLKCARVVTASGAVFPNTETELLSLPGVGPYTAAAIAAIAFGKPATVVDGNIERVMARLFDEHSPLPVVKPVLKAHAAKLTPKFRAGDHAQALMDLGATVCIAKTPRCALCPLQKYCAGLRAGTAATLPKRTPKKPKPTRRGIAFFARRADGNVLLETRPPKGLLGGMRGLVGSEWTQSKPEFLPPFAANWQESDTVIHHVFTHFNLELTLYSANVKSPNPSVGRFEPEVAATDLPSIMRKAYVAGALMLENSSLD